MERGRSNALLDDTPEQHSESSLSPEEKPDRLLDEQELSEQQPTPPKLRSGTEGSSEHFVDGAVDDRRVETTEPPVHSAEHEAPEQLPESSIQKYDTEGCSTTSEHDENEIGVKYSELWISDKELSVEVENKPDRLLDELERSEQRLTSLKQRSETEEPTVRAEAELQSPCSKPEQLPESSI